MSFMRTRLAGARRTEHHADLACRDSERDVAPDELLAEGLGEVVDLDLDAHVHPPSVWLPDPSRVVAVPRYYWVDNAGGRERLRAD